MPSLFDNLMADAGVPVLMDTLADEDTITYTPAGGEGVPVSAILVAETSEEDEELDGPSQKLVREVSILTDPASEWGGVAAPALTATVTIGGVEYAVEAIKSQDANWVALKLVRRGKRQR